MRTLSLVALALCLAACGSDADAPDDGVSTAGPVSDPAVSEAGPLDEASGAGDVSTAGSLGGPLDAATLDGDWTYCSGPSVLDTEASFGGSDVRTYIDGRPGMAMPYTIEGADLVLDDGSRYTARPTRTGRMLVLVTDDGDATYARDGFCP